MRIGELAERTGTTTKTVRYYESIGLLPEPRRTAAGYREYDVDAVERLRFVREAQATGLSLAEIQSVLELKAAGAASCGHTAALLRRHLDELDAQIERLRRARIQLAELAARAEELDPADCTDPNRCQVIDRRRAAAGPAS
jgi:DNA-binding transcriptional MerR regulator